MVELDQIAKKAKKPLALVLPVSAAFVTHGLLQLVSNGWRVVLHVADADLAREYLMRLGAISERLGQVEEADRLFHALVQSGTDAGRLVSVAHFHAMKLQDFRTAMERLTRSEPASGA